MSLAMILFLNWLIFCFYYQKLPKCSRSRERLYTFEFWLLTFSLKIIKINVYGSKKHSYYRYKPLSYMYLRYLINHTMYAISSMCIQCTSIKKNKKTHKNHVQVNDHAISEHIWYPMTSEVIDHLKVYNYLLKLIFRRKFNSLHSLQMRSEKFKLVSYFSSFMINELLQNFFKTCTVIRNILSVSNLNIQTIVLCCFFFNTETICIKIRKCFAPCRFR